MIELRNKLQAIAADAGWSQDTLLAVLLDVIESMSNDEGTRRKMVSSDIVEVSLSHHLTEKVQRRFDEERENEISIGVH